VARTELPIAGFDGPSARPALARRLGAEFLGTLFLVAAVVGSGIAAQRLSPGQPGLELLENALVTGAALVALILVFAPVSGAHLNPVITLADWVLGGSRSREAAAYAFAQTSGAILGAVIANVMFALPAFEWSTKVRSSGSLWLAEGIATFGLVLVVFGLVRAGRALSIPLAVGCYITAAYFFTSSTSFANPAVAVGRMFSNTFAGISPSSVPAFAVAEVVGALVAAVFARMLYPRFGHRRAGGSPYDGGGDPPDPESVVEAYGG
jgi:glycerol uptake facilitator-like aquaporin